MIIVGKLMDGALDTCPFWVQFWGRGVTIRDILSKTFDVEDIDQLGGQLKSIECDKEFEPFRDLIAELCQMHFRPENMSEPYGPMGQFGGQRTIIPADISEDQAKVIADNFDAVEDPCLRARLADLLWLRDRSKAEFGFAAIESYAKQIASLTEAWEAQEDEGQERKFYCTRIAGIADRALNISLLIGLRRPEVAPLKESLVKAFECAGRKNSPYTYLRLARSVSKGGFTSDENILTSLLAYLEKVSDDHRAVREIFLFVAEIYMGQKDQDRFNEYGILAAECLVKLADDHHGNANLEATFLTDGILALRAYKGTKDRRDELQERLSEIQRKKPDELMSFQHETDISDIVKGAKASVQGVSLVAALRELLLHLGVEKKDKIEAQIREFIGKFPLSHMFGAQVMDSQGRVVFNSPGIGLGEEPNEEHLKFQAAQHLQLSADFLVPSIIDPIRRVILQEHLVRDEVLIILAQTSAFVPAGKEKLFAIGMKHFLSMDDMVAAHMLIPQLEDSLRHVLAQKGVQVDYVRDNGIQEFRTIHQLLEYKRQEIIDVFGEDIVFSLDLLFDFRGGPRVRSEVSHGLVSQNWFFSNQASYICWFILHLMFLPLAPVWLNLEAYLEDRFGVKQLGADNSVKEDDAIAEKAERA